MLGGGRWTVDGAHEVVRGCVIRCKMQKAKGNDFAKFDVFVIKSEKITKTSSFAKQNCPLSLAFCLFTQPHYRAGE